MKIDIKFEFATKATSDLIIDSKFDFIDVDFELKLIVNSSNLNDLKLIFVRNLRLTTSTTSDLIIDSKIVSIEIEFKLKLIVNSSNLNDLKNLLYLILKRDLKLTATSTTFNSIVF